MSSKWWDHPAAQIVAVLGGLTFVAFLLAKLIIPAIGVAVDIVKLGLVGAVSAGLVASWTVPAATVTFSVVCVAGSLTVLVNVFEEMRNPKKAYARIFPVLALVGGFMVEVCKEFTPWQLAHVELGKTVFAAMTSVLFLMGGAVWRIKGAALKVVGTLFFLIPPATILADAYRRFPNRSLSDFLHAVDPSTWIAVAALLFLLVLAAALARLLPAEGS